MLIELVGLPGSGKSTLAQDIVNHFGRVTVISGPKHVEAGKLYVARLAIFKIPAFTILLFLCLVMRGGRDVANFRRMMFTCRCYAQLKLLSRRPIIGEAVVLDEGALHALFSCLYGTKANRLSNFFLKRVVKAIDRRLDFYVDMGVSKRKALNRCLQRESLSRFNRSMTSTEAAVFLEDRSYEAILELVDGLKVRSVTKFKGDLCG